ncbi:acyltransferase [Shewanella chilikensis]|uniref:acyltransferase n=1 Tax=Shewanella chilikensis TaxID=558541 RepID=UPI0030068AAB
MRRIIIFLYYFPFGFINRINFLLKNVQCGKRFQPMGIIFLKNRGSLIIGDDFRVNSTPYSNPIGGGERTCFQILPSAKLLIGNRVSFSNVFITVSLSVTISDGVMLGAGVCIFDTDFHSLNFHERVGRRFGITEKVKMSPVYLGRNVFVGTRAIILKGVTIGENSIVSAGSVVVNDIPSNEVWGGNPARYIRKLTESEKLLDETC